MRCRLTASGAAVLFALTGLASAAGSEIRFSEVGLDAGVRVVHDALGYYDDSGNPFQNHIGPGAAWADVNRDGWLDLVVGDGTEFGPGNHMFFNNGDGTFTDMAEYFDVLTGDVTNAVVAGDMNNDGYIDLLFANHFAEADLSYGGRLKLSLSGVLHGLFESNDPHWDGPRHASMALGDFDADGWLDIYMVNQVTAPDLLVQNVGGNNFHATDLIQVSGPGTGFQPMFFDFDQDGDQDIFVVNDVHEDYLYRNDDGVFVEIAGAVKIAGGHQFSDNKVMGMGCAIADFDNDLDEDVYITNYRLNTLYQNPGTWQQMEFSRFREVAGDKGVAFDMNSWGCDFFDADNDGDLDLFVVGGWVEGGIIPQPLEIPNQMYRNEGPPDYRFTNISEAAGVTDGQMGRAQAVGDYDRDGDLDVFVTNNTYYDIDVGPHAEPRTGASLLYRNETEPANHWVTFWLQGSGAHRNGTGCNRGGVGARVYVTAGGQTQMRVVQAGAGYMGHNSIEVEFGLGMADGIDEVRVRWICGADEIFEGCTIDSYYRLTEGRGQALRWPIAFSRVEAHSVADGIRLEWWYAANLGLDVTIFRAAPGEEFVEHPVAVEFASGHGQAIDTDVDPDVEYVYRVMLTTRAGNTATSSMIHATHTSELPPLPSRAELGQNYPNPFNPSTTILVSVPRRMEIDVQMYDVRGKHVRTLYTGIVEVPGTFPIDWDGTDDSGRDVAGGVYYYTLDSEDGSSSRKLTLVR